MDVISKVSSISKLISKVPAIFNSRIVSAMSSPRSGPDDPRDGEGHDGAHPRASGGAKQGDAHEAVHADQGYLVQASHYDQVRREAFKSTSIIEVGGAVHRFCVYLCMGCVNLPKWSTGHGHNKFPVTK